MTPFETLIDKHHDEIYRYVWRMLYNAGQAPEAADDLTQETFERAYRAYPRLRPNSNERAWLYKIATNCTLTALRQSSRQARRVTPLPEDLHLGPPDPGPGPAETTAHRALLDQVQAHIEQLPDKQRSALILRYVHEMAYEELAEILECSEDSARANVYQALKRLRGELAGEFEEWK